MPYAAQTLAMTSMIVLFALAPLGAADDVAPPRFEVDENGAREIPTPSSAMQPAFVFPVQFEAPEANEGVDPSMQLTPPRDAESTSLPLSREATSDPSSPRRSRGASIKNVVTTMVSLGVVLGLFFLVTWIMRRTSPKNHQALPSEVVRVLGRAPQIGRFQLHLLQVGRKVLLVSSSTTAVTPLTEVTDAEEVEQLLALCQVNRHDGVSASFRKVLTQLGREKPTSSLAVGEMLGEDDSPSNPSTWGSHHA